MNQVLNAETRPLVIASQLGQELNGRIADQIPGLTFVDVPQGPLDASATNAEVVLAAPVHGSAARTSSKPPAAWPGAIRWIQLISSGSDSYPRWIFDGPVVTCARGPSAQPIAEFVLATILSAVRGFPDAWATNAQDWQERKFRARDLNGTTLGIVGFGAIGRRVAELALPFGFRILALRRTNAPLGVEGAKRAVNIDEILAQSDYAVLAVPATTQTDHILNRQTLARTKPGLHLINIARGSLIDNEALLEALADGRVSLASLDVTDPEPLPEGHPFYTHPSIRLSPHISMATESALDGVAAKLVANINRYRKGEPLHEIVDVERGY